MKIRKTSYNEELNFFKISLNKKLAVGRNFTLKIDYEAYLNDKLFGFYRSSYDKTGEKIYLGTTQFQVTDARRAFPCFDEPALKATFEIHILRKGEARRSISNMPRIKTKDGGYIVPV